MRLFSVEENSVKWQQLGGCCGGTLAGGSMIAFNVFACDLCLGNMHIKCHLILFSAHSHWLGKNEIRIVYMANLCRRFSILCYHVRECSHSFRMMLIRFSLSFSTICLSQPDSLLIIVVHAAFRLCMLIRMQNECRCAFVCDKSDFRQKNIAHRILTQVMLPFRRNCSSNKFPYKSWKIARTHPVRSAFKHIPILLDIILYFME